MIEGVDMPSVFRDLGHCRPSMKKHLPEYFGTCSILKELEGKANDSD